MGRTPAGQTRERVLRLVRERILAGVPPTVREVQQAFGFRSVQTAREHLDGLVAAGRLTKETGKSRGFRLPAPHGLARRAGAARLPILVPLLGRVPAGPLDSAIEDLEGYLPIQAARGGEELFGLRVRGESMRDAGILDGDIVVVRRQATAVSGDIVVARVGDEATVKRLRVKRGSPELHPDNPDFAPIVPGPEGFVLLGKVIEVRRHLEAR